MKKYLSILVLCGFLLIPVVSNAQVSSTVERKVVPILKKSYQSATSTSATQAPAAPRSVLKRGDRGQDVRDLQAWLYNQGFDPKGIDGVFGPGTRTALIAFQRSTKVLTADGVFGPRTGLYIQDLPTGVAFTKLDSGVVDYLKAKHVAVLSGKDANKVSVTSTSVAKLTPPKTTSRSVLAKLPKSVSAVLSKALPKAPKLTPVAINTTNTPPATTVTKKPKAEVAALLARAKVSLVTARNPVATLAGSNNNLQTNFSQGSAGQATAEYVCAEVDGDNTCVAVPPGIAEAIKSGILSARAVIEEVLENGSDGLCPFCSRDENGNLVWTSSYGGTCGGGGPGSGEFITPDGTPVGTDPEACIPREDIVGKPYTLAVTADNVFTAYWGLKKTDTSTAEQLQVIGQDMNWDVMTPNSVGTHPGWKSGEVYTGTGPNDARNIYFATFHDGWVTHGFMASMTVGGKTYETGSPVFEVTKANVPGPVHPAGFSTTGVLEQISNAVWKQTYLVDDGLHGRQPWGKITGMPDSPKWIFEGSNWDPEGLMQNYEIYKLKICGDEPTTVGPEPSSISGTCRGIGASSADGIAVQMTIDVSFDNPVTVVNGDNGKLAMQVQGAGGNGVTLSYVSGSGTNKLRFQFTPGIPDLTPLANYTGNGKVKFKQIPSGTTVKRTSDQVSVDLSGEWDIPAETTACLPSSSTIVSAKCVNQVLDYNSDANINSSWGLYEVQYNAPVTVTGDPKITFTNTAGNTVTAFFQNMIGNSRLSFKTDDLQKPPSYYYGNNVSITLNGGSIKDAAQQNAPLTLGNFTSSTEKCTVSVENPLSIRQPIASMAGSCSGNDKLIEVTFKAPVTVVNTNFGLKVKDAPDSDGLSGVVYSYVGGSGTNKLTFKYTSPNPDTNPPINYHGTANKLAFWNTSTQSWALVTESYTKILANEAPARLFDLWNIPSGLLSCLPN